jgi:flagellar hook-basal body complex protein FliE
MTAIGPISGVSGVSGVAGVSGIGATGGTAGAQATSGSGSSFTSALGQGLESLQNTQATADNLSIQAATGTLTNAHDLMIATTQAQLATQLTVALRNKAVDAFNEIMRMQI